MNELKQRRRGFLAALLAAVLILGTPGVTAMATNYWHVEDPNDSSYTQLTIDTIVNNGDVIYYISTGNIMRTYFDICSDEDIANALSSDSGTPYTVSGGPYKVFYMSGSTIGVVSTHATNSGTTASDTPISGYYRSLAALVSAIKMEGGETHGYGIGSALPYSVMKALADNPDDVLVFKTDYKGYHYEFTIQVGEDVKDKITPEIPWYGPYWLAKYFYKTTVIEKLPDYS